jgi:hypothetical protein
MSKKIPDAALDGGPDYIQQSNYECLCSQEPTTYTEAFVTYMLAKVALTPVTDLPIADDVNGRKMTVAAKLAVPISNSGSGNHVVLVDTNTSTIRLIDTCILKVVVVDDTIDFPSWKYNFQDPT